MSIAARGVRNAFRNAIRSVSITLILALVIALALVMLLSMKAVQARIDTVQASIGNTISVSPAGARGFEGGGTPLVAADINKIKSTAHVVKVTSSINDRWQTIGTSSVGGRNDTNFAAGATSLVSPVVPGTLGERFGGGRIRVSGTSDPTNTQVAGVNQFKIIAGSNIAGSSTANVAMVGKDLAAKNNLSVGSTFTAYGQTVTVHGIFDAANTFANAGVVMPLPALQTLSGQPGAVTSVVAQVDSIGNASATLTKLQKELGTRADVVSGTADSANTLASLDDIKTISSYAAIGSLIAGAVIIFLSMLMIVRERRREIGVLKAIGSSNGKISLQFVIEALTLTTMAAVLGIVGGVVLSQPVLDRLVTATASGGGGRFGRSLGRGITQFGTALSNVHAVVGFSLLLYGVLTAVIIAVVGSALPAWLTAKVRPAEVMRTE